MLYNSCRVVEGATHPIDVARRLYPSGGCRHSLEIYVLIHRCPSIENGAYRYEPFDHTMDLLRREDAPILTLLREAQVSTGVLQDLPSALLVFTSRLYRVTEKYQSIGYRLVLLEVGALYQTIYLVATALGLSVSAIGTGDSDCFSEALGTDYFAEPSVGEMIVGGASDSIL
jgi:SagB-type dehydrogenase family enzyme